MPVTLKPVPFGGTQNPIPPGPHVPGTILPFKLQISGCNGNYTVLFEGVKPKDSNNPLDIDINQNSVITFTLDTSNCDWEFDPAAGVTLGTLQSPKGTYVNLTENVDGNGRYTTATLEATFIPPPAANEDQYNLNFIIYKDPCGTVYPGGKSWGTPDPHFWNPGRPGLTNGGKRRD